MVFRRVILSVAARPAVVRVMSRHGLSMGARRFVAGVTLDEGVRAARDLKARGLLSTLDYLGEKVTDLSVAAQASQMYVDAIRALAAAGLQANVSLKLSQLGLLLDAAACAANVRRIVEEADRVDGFVRIDMEESNLVDATLRLYRSLASEFPRRVGVVLQAYLYRTEADLRALLPLRPNVRLCKGAYSEPPAVAFPRKRDVDANYRRLLRVAMEGGAFVAVATHDESLIEYAIKTATELRLEDRYELQMLYGVKPRLQQRLADSGMRVRVYVPFGTQWYPYLVRRVAERPANLWFVLKGLRG